MVNHLLFKMSINILEKGRTDRGHKGMLMQKDQNKEKELKPQGNKESKPMTLPTHA